MKLLPVLALSLVASSVMAQSALPSRTYFGVGVGVNKVDNQVPQFNSAIVSAVGGTVSSTQDSSVNNLRLLGGYKLNESVAVELGYTKTSKANLSFAGNSGGNVAYAGGANVSFAGLDVSAVLRPSVASGWNNAYALIGVHNYSVKASTTFTVGGTGYSASDSDSGTGTMFGFGYDFEITKGLDARLGVTRVNKIGGESDAKTTNYGLTLIQHF